MDEVKSAFGNKSFYEILNISNDDLLTPDDIKHAYRKMALKYHPDKGGNAEQFKALSFAYSILSDSQKRKLYDESGSIDGDDANKDFDTWYSYYRELFPKVNVVDIIKFQEKYIGSIEERQDVISFYCRFAGDVDRMMNYIMFAEVGDEFRICEIIADAIACNDIESLPLFESSMKKYSKRKSASVSSVGKKKAKAPASDVDSLQQLMLSRQAERGAKLMSDIVSKYETPTASGKGKGRTNTKKSKSEYEISDEEFAKLRSNLKAKSSV